MHLYRKSIIYSFTDSTEKSLLTNISRYKLGFNFYSFYNEENLIKNHNFVCDVCGKFNNGVQRYICLNCEDGLMPTNGLTDICELCFINLYVDKNDDFNDKKKHKKNHVYLWMVYNGYDYYNY